jgi:uncharacterized protein (DUF1684 family)
LETEPSAGPSGVDQVLSLLDWKRRVSDLYRAVRNSSPEEGWRRWRDGRDSLFREHPQSPLPPEARSGFAGLEYFGYDVGLRVPADVEAAPHEEVAIGASAGRPVLFERFGRARFSLAGAEHTLDVFWLDAYGGGLFLPFADATSGAETYGAGRYLLDTVKGSDLGTSEGRLVLDLNFAYNPSCAYDPRWACPLAPPGNRLAVPVRAGELVYREG